MLDFPHNNPKDSTSRRVPIDDAAWYLTVVFNLIAAVGYFLLGLLMALGIGFESTMGYVGGELVTASLAVFIFVIAQANTSAPRNNKDTNMVFGTTLFMTLGAQAFFYWRLFCHYDLSLSEKAGWTEMLP